MVKLQQIEDSLKFNFLQFYVGYMLSALCASYA